MNRCVVIEFNDNANASLTAVGAAMHVNESVVVNKAVEVYALLRAMAGPSGSLTITGEDGVPQVVTLT